MDRLEWEGGSGGINYFVVKEFFVCYVYWKSVVLEKRRGFVCR